MKDANVMFENKNTHKINTPFSIDFLY